MMCTWATWRTSLSLFTIFFNLLASYTSFPLPDACCRTELRKIDWGLTPYTGWWCDWSQDARSSDCGPVCREPEAHDFPFVLECPTGLSRDCVRGCVYIDMTAQTGSLLVGEAGSSSQSCEHSGPEDYLDWARSRGAFVDVRLKLLNASDSPDMIRGMYASDAIADGEVVVSIPPSLILKGDASEDRRLGSWCTLVPALRAELQLQKCSPFWPYLKTLLDVHVEVPNTWSLQDLALLSEQPAVNWVRHSEQFTSRCKRDVNDTLTARALQLIVSRAGPGYVGMVPINDLFNHRGGNWTNVYVITPAKHGGVDVIASKNIAKGSQVYSFYKPGAPWVFRDYGFVEQTPAIWWFDVPGERFEWTLEDERGRVTWHAALPRQPSAAHLRRFQTGARALLVQSEEKQREAIAISNSSRHQQLAATYQGEYIKALQWALADAAKILAQKRPKTPEGPVHHEI